MGVFIWIYWNNEEYTPLHLMNTSSQILNCFYSQKSEQQSLQWVSEVEKCKEYSRTWNIQIMETITISAAGGWKAIAHMTKDGLLSHLKATHYLTAHKSTP